LLKWIKGTYQNQELFVTTQPKSGSKMAFDIESS